MSEGQWWWEREDNFFSLSLSPVFITNRTIDTGVNEERFGTSTTKSVPPLESLPPI